MNTGEPPPINPHFWRKAKQAEINFRRLFQHHYFRHHNRASIRRRRLYWGRLMEKWLMKAISK